MRTDVEIPLRAFRGPLKRHRLEENEPMSRLIVDLAFPHFRGRDTRDAQSNRMNAMFYGPDGRNFLPAQSPRRRFSGDSFARERLPRGRYFSVARSYPPGYSPDEAHKFNDNGVVRNELVAYANFRVAGPLSVLDVHDRTDRQVLRNMGFLPEGEPQKTAFRVIFFRRKGAQSILDLILTECRTDRNWDWDKWGGAVTTTLVNSSPFPFLGPEQGFIDTAQSFDLYYGFEDVSLSKVADLRHPDTQEAFVRLFCPRLMNAPPDVGAVGGFLEMLPTLVSQDLGGTLGTDVIGAYLRSVGAEALIYPSARCNVEVEIRDKQLAGFHGWNLVDYRDAAIDSLPDLPAFSLTAIDQGIGIEAPPAGNDMFYGSWRMKGSSERAVRRFEAEVKSYFNASPA